MLFTRRATTEAKLTEVEARRVVAHLRAVGWAPVGLEAEIAAARVANLSEEAVVNNGIRVPRGPDGPGAGDVFFHDKDAYYFFALNTEDTGRMLFFSPDDEAVTPSGQDSVEIGVVSTDGTGLEKRIQDFGEAVVAGIKETIDGRRFRHLSFNWIEPPANQGKLGKLCERLEKEGARVRFNEPQFDETALDGSRLLLDIKTREILRDLSSAGGFALESDIIRSRGEDAKAILVRLTKAGLSHTSIMVQCRQSSRPLTRVDDPELVQAGSGGDLQCATCGRRFADELMIPGYGIATLGTTLIRGSHWMTVWVTAQLLVLGAEQSAVLWNLEESSEEIDIVLEFLGELWILELKDRDFDQRDAHSLNYRRVRYRPDKTFVVTSGVVAPDARRVFEDVARENEERSRYGRVGVPRTVRPEYIEGLDKVESGLKSEFERAALSLAQRSLRPAAVPSGFQASRLLSTLTDRSGPSARRRR